MFYVQNNNFSDVGLYYSGESQPAFTCSKLTSETLEKGVKYAQSYQ